MNVNQSKLICFVFACLAMLLLPFQLQAETPVVEKPHTFSAGTPARASEVNANFDVAYEYIHKLLNVVCKYHPSEPLCQTTDIHQNLCARQQIPRKPIQTISA